MDTSTSAVSARLSRRVWLPFVLLCWLASAASAQTAQADPPGRIATLTRQVGSVVFAPDGEEEWVDLPLNRPLTRGDRIWTDAGARAELHMGTGTIHLDGRTHLAFYELDDLAAQLSVTQGSLNLRVRDLAPRENVEVDTPNVAVRAIQPSDVRVDVDPTRNTTHVDVRSGEVLVFGQGGESLRLAAGDQETYEGRDLARSATRYAGNDDFDRWVQDQLRREDQSVSARYVPRDVVGYYELDDYGSWANEANYGAVWYPRITVSDWAPYRYGHWAWIAPWGWTWVDEAPWGFAPFHYGRWAVIGGRWAWVPGTLGPRPYYAPALVAFVGGGGFSISIGVGSGPGIGWYPLAPGEAWYPTYRVTNVYLQRVNRHERLGDARRDHFFRHRTDAVTAVRVDDFNRGRPVHDRFRPLRPNEVNQLTTTTTLPKPDREARVGAPAGPRASRLSATPPAQVPGVVPSNPSARRDLRDDRREPQVREPQPRESQREPGRAQRDQQDRAQKEQSQSDQERAQREQSQRDQERGARDQQQRQQREQAQREQQRQQQERAQQDRAQREQAVREQQQRQQQERAQREQAVREQQQRQQQERAQREQAVRQQQQQQQEQRAAQQREQAVRQQQERAERAQEKAQERAQQQQQQREARPQRDDDSDNGRGRRGRD